MPTDPKPGLYRHYSGDHYRLILVADHHEHDGRRVAVYHSLTHGTVNARQVEKVGAADREDCWNDCVVVGGAEQPRFQLVQEAVGPGRLWPAQVWLQLRRFSDEPYLPAIECGEDDSGGVLFTRAESIPRDLLDALHQVEQARGEADAASRRVAELEARVRQLEGELAAQGRCG